MQKLILIVLLYIFVTCLLSEQIRPISGSVINYTQVLFEWEQEPNASYYHFQLSDDIMFTNIINSIYDSTLIIILNEKLDRGTDFYWRIRPYFSNDSNGQWIDTSFFHIETSIFDDITIEAIDADKVDSGVIIFSTWRNPNKRTGIFDNDGSEIWNDKGNPFMMTNIDNYGQILGFIGHKPIVYDLNNSKVWDGGGIYMNYHDVIQLPSGNFMGFHPVWRWGEVPDGWENLIPLEQINWSGTRIVEWDKETKEELWDWNVFDYYNFEDYDSLGGHALIGAINSSSYDWLHTNSIYFDENEQAIYLSHRHISRITKIAYPSGEIIWMMGLPTNFMSLSLPAGSEDHICTDLLFSFQHHVTLLDNGHLLFYDNGNFSTNFFDIDEKVSRILEVLVIDNNYCELIWEYILPSGFGASRAYGSVQLLNNGNYLVNTYSPGENKTILEISPEKEIVFQANLGVDTHNYRAFRIPSIHPEAISILVDDLMEVQLGNISEDRIILSESDNVLSVHIYNESKYNHQFNYSLYNERNWLEIVNDTLFINAQSDTTILFEVDFNENPTPTVNFEYNFLPYKYKSITWTIYKRCNSGDDVLDECGVCGGSGIPDGVCDCAGNVLDEDGVCDADEIVGCQDETACNYDATPTTDNMPDLCIYSDGICETCSGETDGSGIVVDNDTDDDTVCDADEIVGCQDETACNYDETATDEGDCTYVDGICEACSGETDGSGIVVGNDRDDDTVCDADEIVGCQDETACNYDETATDEGDYCTYNEENYECDGNCTAELDECGECGGDGPVEGFNCDGEPLSLFNGLIPENFSIHSIYPNPFNPSTNIIYGLPENTETQIIVFDMSGTHMTILVNTFQTAGYHTISWNASSYPSGVYFIRMESGDFTQTQKMVLIK